ncbi:hypothetical protein GCM10009639_41090 [Kitasatospora putterlickiae]|uniref:Uncharacterized protein n=1 Tax=Kitasatospora putterlickiae TaxID=221725 RepID=A0ABN1Y7R2_9ACTN
MLVAVGGGLLGWRPAVALADRIDRFAVWLKATPDAEPDRFTSPVPAVPAA